MPSRNNAANSGELASRSVKETAPTSTLRLSDIYAYASHPALSIARLWNAVQQGRGGNCRHSCRARKPQKMRRFGSGKKGAAVCRRLKAITGRRQTEWTGATRCPEVGRIL